MKCNIYSIMTHYHLKKDYVVPQKHTGFEIVYYISGKGTTVIDGISYQYEEQSVAVITPGSIHDETAIEQGEVIFCIFNFEDKYINLESTVINNKSGNNIEIYKLLLLIKDELLYQKPNYEQMINLYLGQIIITIGRILDKKGRPSNIISYIKNTIEQNYRMDINFNELAYSIGYSYDRLRHIFKDKTGISLTQYLINVRMVNAKKMLQDTELSISCIGKSCGFKNVANFITAFKQRVGITPCKYRQKVFSATKEVLNFSTEGTGDEV